MLLVWIEVFFFFFFKKQFFLLSISFFFLLVGGEDVEKISMVMHCSPSPGSQLLCLSISVKDLK